MNRYRFYTGPTIVHAIAEKIRRTLASHGVSVVSEGTEHVYLDTDKDLLRLIALIRDHIGQGFTFRDVRLVFTRPDTANHTGD